MVAIMWKFTGYRFIWMITYVTWEGMSPRDSWVMLSWRNAFYQCGYWLIYKNVAILWQWFTWNPIVQSDHLRVKSVWNIWGTRVSAEILSLEYRLSVHLLETLFTFKIVLNSALFRPNGIAVEHYCFQNDAYVITTSYLNSVCIGHKS